MKNILLCAVIILFSVIPLHAKVGGNTRKESELIFPENGLTINSRINTKRGEGSYLTIIFQKDNSIIDKRKLKIVDWDSEIESDVQYSLSIENMIIINNELIITIGRKRYKFDIQ